MTNYESHATHRTLPRVSQETLSELVRTTRSRVNFSMDEFRKLAFHRVQPRLEGGRLSLGAVLLD